MTPNTFLVQKVGANGKLEDRVIALDSNTLLGINNAGEPVLFPNALQGNKIAPSFLHAEARIPAGTVLDFAGSAAPTGYLLAYGQEVNRTTFADLFAAIGTTYGNGNGTTTFNLPDLRGRVSAGKDDMGGASADRLNTVDSTNLGAGFGAQEHTLDNAQIGNALFNATFDFVDDNSDGSTAEILNGASSSTGAPHNNIQPTLILNKIIKT